MKKLIPGRIYYHKYSNKSSIFIVLNKLKEDVINHKKYIVYNVKHIILNDNDYYVKNEFYSFDGEEETIKEL